MFRKTKKESAMMKQQTKQQISKLISQADQDNSKEIAQKLKAILAADETVTPEQADEMIGRFLKQMKIENPNSSPLTKEQKITEGFIALARFACKKLSLKHVTALIAKKEGELLTIYAKTPEGNVELDFYKAITPADTKEKNILLEVEKLLASGADEAKVIVSLNSYGKSEQKAKSAPSAKAQKMAHNLVMFAKYYIKDNDIRNAQSAIARYDDKILDLYVKTTNDEIFVDLEELVGDDEQRHAMLNEIFDDSLTLKDIKSAIAMVNEAKL